MIDAAIVAALKKAQSVAVVTGSGVMLYLRNF